ncbi:unnamed protein product [Caenorhabditis angaria]|uniref:non-specific serine/threonine protein kinase n=1 Tax=Caenorhabditis angaria TaxID=860376 RepID=A0A9P1MX38_9PELO|nr:unnamed protein product [Caenorhabditis angaria]
MDLWPSILDADQPHHTTSIANSFFMTFYVGESPFGLYAVDALVDHQTITYSPKLLGPPLLEGPAPIALSDAEKEQYLPPKRPIVRNIPSITHKTLDGEFLLLGYHETPQMTLTSIIPTRFPNYGHNQYSIGYNNDIRRLPGPDRGLEHRKKQKIENDEDDSSLGEIVWQIYVKHTRQFYGAIISIGILIVSVVWMCGRQWGQLSQQNNSNMGTGEIAGETRSAQTSRQSNGGNKPSWSWVSKKIEIPDGWMAVGSKLIYNPTDILGTGCEGTVVYKGTFDGRDVAVKRVVSKFVKFAHREADLLRESDAHPHVIRYFCMESDSQFRYLALELCVASLNDFVEQEDVRKNVNLEIDEILRQATAGLTHLHASKIVHRDIKPQNILITMPNQRGDMRIVISDFGLCKRVQPGRNSLSRGVASGLAGTEGWIAPEVLISESTSYPVDIFSLGCIFYYVLSRGTHPFGKSLHRQTNIVNGHYSLEKIQESHLAIALIETMLDLEPNQRPSAQDVENHPYFWNAETKLAFFSVKIYILPSTSLQLFSLIS